MKAQDARASNHVEWTISLFALGSLCIYVCAHTYAILHGGLVIEIKSLYNPIPRAISARIVENSMRR